MTLNSLEKALVDSFGWTKFDSQKKWKRLIDLPIFRLENYFFRTLWKKQVKLVELEEIVLEKREK